jgi:hypothetical protein
MGIVKRVVGSVALSAVISCVALALPAGAASNNGTDHFGPFPSTSVDNGTCGPWANDTFNRFFTVHNNGNGTFTVTEEFKDGSFVTTGPASPGCAETTDSHHGTVVTPGITGNMQGRETGTVTSSTYNPNSCSAPGADCTTTAGFISAVFGPAASFNVTDFNFEYNSSDQALQYHHWSDKYNPGQATEQFIGDIATQ